MKAKSLSSGKPAQSSKVDWFPNQKGAWAMMIVPFLVGTIGGCPHWHHLVLGCFWISGYALFFTLSDWLISKRKPRFLPPVRLWTLLTMAGGLVSVAVARELWPWALMLAPLLTIAFWQTLTKRPRSLLARTCEILASGISCLVAWDLGDTQRDFWDFITATAPSSSAGSPALSGWHPLVVTLMVTYYFWSTVPYVKSLVRERKNPRYQVLCLVSQLLGLALSLVLGALGLCSWWSSLFWVIFLARAVFFSRQAQKVFDPNIQTRLTPRNCLVTVGFTEMALTLAYVPTLLIS